MARSGIENAIIELQREQKSIQEAIAMLNNFYPVTKPARRKQRLRKPLSAQARRRISQAAKKRWVARRASKK